MSDAERPRLRLVTEDDDASLEVLTDALAMACVAHPGWTYRESAAQVLNVLRSFERGGLRPGQLVDYQLSPAGKPRRGTFLALDAGAAGFARVVPEGMAAVAATSVCVPLALVSPR